MTQHVARRARAAGESGQVTVALWLVLMLQRLGLRPLAALRGPLPQSERIFTPGDRELRVSVHIDKDNKVGVCSATRRRLLPLPHGMAILLRRHLPYPNSATALRVLSAARNRMKRRFQIQDLRSARRNAISKAEDLGMDPAAVANHRPGSRATSHYTGSVTSVGLQRNLVRLLE